MRKRQLLEELACKGRDLNHVEPPERAVFFFEDEVKVCICILAKLVSSSDRLGLGNHRAIALPDVDLPMIF